MTKLSFYENVLEDIHRIMRRVGRPEKDATIVAVIKGKNEKEIASLYTEGCRFFGESRLQEARHQGRRPKGSEFHFIGPLQSNKLKQIADSFDLIHSVGSLRYAKILNRLGEERARAVPILVQVNVSREPTKQGEQPSQWEHDWDSLMDCPFLQIKGLMTIAPDTEDRHIIRTCFSTLRILHEKWKYNTQRPELFTHLSMGMSSDYAIALEEGATLLRLGSILFTSEKMNALD